MQGEDLVERKHGEEKEVSNKQHRSTHQLCTISRIKVRTLGCQTQLSYPGLSFISTKASLSPRGPLESPGEL